MTMLREMSVKGRVIGNSLNDYRIAYLRVINQIKADPSSEVAFRDASLIVQRISEKLTELCGILQTLCEIGSEDAFRLAIELSAYIHYEPALPQ